MKFLWLLALAIAACRLVTGRWPWQFLGRKPSSRITSARALLGVSSNASYSDIVEAHRRLITLVHPDKGGSNEQVHEANAARDLLLAALQEHK